MIVFESDEKAEGSNPVMLTRVRYMGDESPYGGVIEVLTRKKGEKGVTGNYVRLNRKDCVELAKCLIGSTQKIDLGNINK
jgi:hypothetical protein